MLVSLVVKLEYFILLIHTIISVLIALVIIVLSLLLITQQPDIQKLSSYECGFDSFGDARSPFSVHFYLVGILFIVFDLEVTFLFPWAVSLDITGSLGFWNMFVFLFILTVGFIYEWLKGALNWT
jgi:NADH:ubiquinone oxidoreductase subunit 3 (subunit A)